MFYLLIAAFFWGTSFIAGKYAYMAADPALVVLFRLLIASIITLPFSIHYCRQVRPTKALLIKITWLGFLTYPITFLFQFMGLKLTSASSAATILGLEPLLIPIVGALFFNERIKPLVLFLGTLAFSGVVLVVGNDPEQHISLWGCTLVFFSAIIVAFWVRLSQQVLQKIDAKIYTILSLQLGTLIGLPIMLLLVKDWQIHDSSLGIGAIFYLGIICSLITSWCWNKGLEHTATNFSGIFLALEPVFAVLLAISLLGERLSLSSSIGVILVLLAAGICMILPKQS